MKNDPSDEILAKRITAAENIMHGSRRGSIEGVNFDLRHDDLDANNWGCSTTWLLGFGSSDVLVFPWMDRTPLAERIEGARDDFRKNGQWYIDTLDVHIARMTAEFQAEIVVAPGESVRISRVEKESIGGPLDPEEDREVRHAHFEVVRASGEIVSVPKPITFHRHGAFASSPRQVTLEKVAQRICTAFGQEPGYGNALHGAFSICLCAANLIYDTTGDSAEDEETFLESLLGAVQHLAQEREVVSATLTGRKFDFTRVTKGSMEDYWRTHKFSDFDVVRVFDRAVALGYHWAMYEAEANLIPLAQASLAQRRDAIAGGKRSGEVRRKKAQEVWQDLVLAEAVRLRAANPGWSQDKLALEISFAKDGQVPGTRTIKSFISRMEKQKKLLRAVRK